MRIALIIYRLNIRGGSQREALSFAMELKRRGHEVTLYTFYYDRENCFPEMLDEFKIVALSERFPDWEKSVAHFWRFFRRPSFFLDMKKVRLGSRLLAGLIDPATDILNPTNHWVYQVAYFYKRDVKNIPSVWMINTFPSQTWIKELKGRSDASLALSWHKKVFYYFTDAYEILKYMRAQDTIMVLDERDKKRARKFFRKEATVVRNGVDDQHFWYQERVPPSGRSVKLLSVALFMPHRRFEDVVEAVAVLVSRGQDVILDVVGDYSANPYYLERLQQIIEARNISGRVTFLGEASDKTLIPAYHSHDIFVHSNHLQSWGLVVFEAMSTGLPAIISKSVGAASVLTDGIHAVLAEPKSPDSIANAAERLIQDPTLFSSVSRNGRVFVEENISWKRYTDTMLGAFTAAQLNFKSH